MRVAIVAGPGDGCWLSELAEDGTGHGPVVWHDDCPAAVATYERSGGVRWVWAAAAGVYPALLRAGVRVERCHDIALTEALLLAREGRPGEPASLAGAWARLRGAAAPVFPGGRPAAAPRPGQDALFDPADPVFPDPRAALDAVIEVHAGQQRRIAADEHPGRFALLVAAESAGGLIAAEMGFDGLPWRADVHDELLTGLLGPRPVAGMRPAKVADLAARISGALGRPVNPDSPAQVLRALAANGVRVPSTRSGVLRGVDHPAAPLLLEYKELARLHAAHGWAWLDEWVAGGRFRAEYVVGGVVSGRWASRGGGALQIPRVLRRAVVADPGHVLVVADAAQLEPRVLAALAGDRALAAAAGTGDLYEALAGAFGGDRGTGQGRAAVGHVRGRGRRGGPVAGGVAAAVPARRAVRGGGGQGGGGGAGRQVAAGAHLPAALGRVARADRGAGRPGRGGGAGGPVAAGPRPFHPQLCRAGERGRLGDRAAGRPPPPPGGDFTAKRDGRPPRCPCRGPAG